MSGTGGFQTQAYNQPAIGVAGDFASQNPYFTYDAGPGGLVAGAGGVTTGLFGWVYPPQDPDGTPTIVQNFGNKAPDGFVMRNMQALITNYLAFAGSLIQPGFGMTLMTGGDFLVQNDGTAEAEVGDKAFAILATGKCQFAPTGTIIGGASATASSIAAGASSVTGSVAAAPVGAGDSNSVLTVTAVGSGTLYPGTAISGTGIPTNPAPKIVSQITPLLAGEATGGVGRYSLDVAEITAASTTVTGAYGILTIGTATGVFVVGDVLTGTGVVAGTAITANITGSGGTGGTMAVNNATVVSSTTITASVAVETKWIARSTGLAGEVVKISDHP